MAPRFIFRTITIILILALSLVLLPSPARALPAGGAATLKTHVIKFYLDPALVSDLDFVETALQKYVEDMNVILSKNTSRRLVFDPQTGIILTGTKPHTDSARPPLPTEGFEIWAHAVWTDQPTSYGGYAGMDVSGAGVLAGLKWTRIHNPEMLVSTAEVTDYTIQIDHMLHELAHVFGAGLGEYYSLASVTDTTNASPLLNINLNDPADPFWSGKPDFMTDPLLRFTRAASREAYLSAVRFSDLTVAVLNGSYRNGIPSFVNFTVRVMDDVRQPLAGVTVKAWKVRGTAPYTSQLVLDGMTDENGDVVLSWGDPISSHNADNFLHLIKVYPADSPPQARYVSIFDADIARLVKQTDSHLVTFELTGQDALPNEAPPTVVSIRRTGPLPADAASVDFAVNFSKAVSSVDAADFTAVASGSLQGVQITAVTGAASEYIVTVQSGSGIGTLRLDIPASAAINDLAGSPLANLPYESGETHSVHRVTPAPLAPADGESHLSTRPSFEWAAIPGAASYQIQAARNDAFSPLLLNKSVNSRTFVSTSTLPVNAVIHWRVRAKIGAAYGPWSEVWTFTTGNPPSVPTLTTPANNALVTGDSPLFDWKDSTLPAGTTFDHYQFQIATDNAFANIIHDVDLAGVTNSQDNAASLNPAAIYYWRVRAWNTAGDHSAWSSARSVRIKYTPPDLLAPADGSNPGTLRPIFTWTAAPGATSYTLQVSRSASFSPLAINRTISTPAFAATANLLPGITYYWRVRVNGLFGPGDWSTVFTFTTP